MTPIDAATAALVERFEACTLDAFPHVDHVRVAWAHAHALPQLEAIARMREGLQRFAASRGVPGKYHETITWAFVALVHERVARDPSAAWPAFADANRDLLDPSVLAAYYRPETLASPLARRCFVLPDAVR